MTGRIFLKLIGGLVCVMLLALLAVNYSTTIVGRDSYIENLTRQLADECHVAALAVGDTTQVDADRVRALAKAAGGRVTVVRSDGQVLADSEADPAHMENHRTRPELIAAFAGRLGSNERTSATLGIPFLYVATPIPNGAIRIAVPVSEVDERVNGIRKRILFGAALAFVPAILIAALLARWISGRFAAVMRHANELARGNFRSRLERKGGGEFGQLSQTLNVTAENLQETVEQLQREHAELEKLERIRKDFVINVSHELRTPLASIQGYTETLIDGALDDPAHNMRFLHIIRHNAERLARLTEDLLTLSRVEQKRQNLEFAGRRVNAMLEDVLDLIRPMAEKRGIQLTMEPAAADAEAWCDSEAVSQMLSNLLDNAIKYTPPGGSIVVGARRTGDFHELFVRDSGVGIPAEDLPRLFERFYRVDKARSRELGGTGLGLSIVKHLAASHGGSVRVESQPSKGSTFFLTLPVDGAVPAAERFNPEFTAS